MSSEQVNPVRYADMPTSFNSKISLKHAITSNACIACYSIQFNSIIYYFKVNTYNQEIRMLNSQPAFLCLAHNTLVIWHTFFIYIGNNLNDSFHEMIIQDFCCYGNIYANFAALYRSNVL